MNQESEGRTPTTPDPQTSFDRGFRRNLALLTDKELEEKLLEMQKAEQSAESLGELTWYSNRIDWCVEEQKQRRNTWHRT